MHFCRHDILFLDPTFSIYFLCCFYKNLLLDLSLVVLTMYFNLYNIGCVLYLFKVVSPTALMDAKTLLMNAFDENSDGKIDIAEVSSSSSLMIMVTETKSFSLKLISETLELGCAWLRVKPTLCLSIRVGEKRKKYKYTTFVANEQMNVFLFLKKSKNYSTKES